MTSKTHKTYSIAFALLAGMFMYKNEVTLVNYYMTLIILLLVSKHGALFPDVDHTWQNVKEKTTVNWVINKLIHLTGGRHRSWQTHSIDIFAVFMVIVCIIPNYLLSIGKLDIVNKEVMSLILIGFACGWGSHLFSDMLTSGGVRLFCFSKFKIKIVPRELFGLRFNTGDSWEEFNYKFMRVINLVIGIISIMYPFILNWMLMK